MTIPGKLSDAVLHFAKLTAEVGFDGVVCSGQEVKMLRNESKIPDDFLMVTPGIRQKDGSDDDQERITTPTVAIQDGSDYLVIGRPMTNVASATEILKEVTAVVNNLQV